MNYISWALNLLSWIIPNSTNQLSQSKFDLLIPSLPKITYRQSGSSRKDLSMKHVRWWLYRSINQQGYELNPLTKRTNLSCFFFIQLSNANPLSWRFYFLSQHFKCLRGKIRQHERTMAIVTQLYTLTKELHKLEVAN